MAERFKLVGGVFNLILRDGKVLMELRKNKFDAGLYSLVGGCMERRRNRQTGCRSRNKGRSQS